LPSPTAAENMGLIFARSHPRRQLPLARFRFCSSTAKTTAMSRCVPASAWPRSIRRLPYGKSRTPITAALSARSERSSRTARSPGLRNTEDPAYDRLNAQLPGLMPSAKCKVLPPFAKPQTHFAVFRRFPRSRCTRSRSISTQSMCPARATSRSVNAPSPGPISTMF